MKRLLSIRIRKVKFGGETSYVWSDHGGWGDSIGKSWLHALYLAVKGDW